MEMTPEQEAHLQKLKDTFCKMIDLKYRKGVAEHGGNLWNKENLIEEAIFEVLDLWTYLMTAKEQRDANQRADI